MAKDLGGYGDTAGQSVGGTGANLNERPDHSTPGGGFQGHAGDRDGRHSNTGAINTNMKYLQPGENYATPWGNVTINQDGHPEMNADLTSNLKLLTRWKLKLEHIRKKRYLILTWPFFCWIF